MLSTENRCSFLLQESYLSCQDCLVAFWTVCLQYTGTWFTAFKWNHMSCILMLYSWGNVIQVMLSEEWNYYLMTRFCDDGFTQYIVPTLVRLTHTQVKARACSLTCVYPHSTGVSALDMNTTGLQLWSSC